MKIEKLIKKMKPFFNNTEAISPIIATIMVLVVAVAAGAGLYFWFDNFQEGAQEEVGAAATGNMRTMSIGSANIVLRPLDENPSLDGIDAANDTTIDNNPGNGAIWFAHDYELPGSRLGPNGETGLAWQDERIIVEIPITISSSVELEDIVLTMNAPEVNKGALRHHMWLRLDKDNDYQLLKKDGTLFKGFINDSTDKVYEDDTNGYTYYFGGKNHIGLDMLNGIRDNATGTLADNGSYYPQYGGPRDESALSPPTIPKIAGALRVMELFTSTGSHYWAFAKNETGSDLGWITCDYRSDGRDKYFTGTDKLEEMFHSGTYEVADKLTPNEAVTLNTYFMISIMSLDNYKISDEGSAEIVLPFIITTKEGVTETSSVTLTIKD